MTQLDYPSFFRKKKVCIIVPTYNNDGTLHQVVNSLLVFTDQIIIVNDGSTDSTLSILASYPQLQQVIYSKNVGKGWALRQGFAKALELGYEHSITIDSDGQHFAEDLPQFLEKTTTDPDAIIIGARNMDQASIPGKSSFGHKMRNIHFLTKKFEFEIEVLVRSFWKGIPITHVPVKVFYAEKGVRVTHFRPFKDFTRITILNTVLVTWALLYIHPRDFFRSLKKKS
jgi:glycosyltransferase involved in cell wall biosynthesis